jgi:hypothetical protein
MMPVGPPDGSGADRGCLNILLDLPDVLSTRL